MLRLRKEANLGQASLSDDELCAWWAAEGSAPNKNLQSHFEYVTQDDLEFVKLFIRELQTRGYASKLVMVKPGSYSARANAASAYKFLMDIVMPRKKRIPIRRYKQARAHLLRLKGTMGRGLGRDIRGTLR